MQASLKVNEIYLSLQGESTWAGLPCIFVRLTGCPLRCSYCDSAFAFRDGEVMTSDAVRTEVGRLARLYNRQPGLPNLPLVEFTGGEPLAQSAVLGLMRQVCDDGFVVLLETSGALDIGPVDPRVKRIVDLKCPSSGESARNLWANVDHLREGDEVKFVVATEEDYAWLREVLGRYRLSERCAVLLSWAAPLTGGQRDASLKARPSGHRPMDLRALADRVVTDGLPVRFQLQLHKYIWPPDQRRV
jgi:7-carboxy-7-deazaguanine synthase